MKTENFKLYNGAWLSKVSPKISSKLDDSDAVALLIGGGIL